ncbi:hypothetical protein [Phaeobacter sp. S60]|uniref:hypothetical protein n=1 Tax=Phaeobacter sp. S60 TaxID=1569353 RepID=UPI00058D6C1B|nr:hypothetical protein [Phaeobacter sp. S60]KII11265.1 hypothetical protein OO25_21795 [Phaeobacter sp. S60]
MANRVLMPRALDGNGDIVPGAMAYFFKEGTVSPLTVYSDKAGTVVVPPPLVADSAGNFIAVFTDKVLKLDIRDPDTNTSLPGFPSDNWHVTTTDETGAGLVKFTPITGNSATNVQAAIANLTGLWNAVTAYGKSLIAASDAASARTTLGLGAVATRGFLDEDDMASDSATAAPSQQSVKAFVGTEVDGKALGVGQSWQNLTGSRNANTSYQNATGRPIQWMVHGSTSGLAQVSTDGSAWVTIATLGAPGSFETAASATIPPDHFYRTTGGFTNWSELR